MESRFVIFTIILVVTGFGHWGMAATGTSVASAQKTCVVAFVYDRGPVAELIKWAYLGMPNTELHMMASGLDFINCVRSRATEIVIIGETLVDPKHSPLEPVPLGLFRAADLAGEVEVDKLLEQPMRVARMELLMQAATLQGVALRSVRLMSCKPQQVLLNYPNLRFLLEENKIPLDIAPSNQFWSWIEGFTVTSPAIDWMAKHNDCAPLHVWRTDENPYCRDDSWPGCNRKTARYCTAYF